MGGKRWMGMGWDSMLFDIICDYSEAFSYVD